AIKLRRGNDLACLRASAAVKPGNQLAHWCRAASVEQLLKLRDVVPPRGRLACVGLPVLRKPARRIRPIKGAIVARQRRAQGDLDTGADRKLDFGRADNGRRAVSLGAEFDA